MPFNIIRLSVCLLLCCPLFALAQSITELSGTIEDIDKGSFVTIGTLSDNEKRDSTETVNGSFRFTVAPKGGELYFLGYSSHHQDYGEFVYVEKGTHTSIRISHLGTALQGCPLAEEQNLFNKGMYSIGKAKSAIDSTLQTNIDSVTKSELIYREKQIDNELNSYYAQWALNHKQSPFSVTVIYMYLQGTNASLTRSLYSQLSEHAKQNNTVADVMPYLFAMQEENEKMKVGDVFADFILPDTSGAQTSFYTLKGNNYVLLDIWASWCNPCRKSMPDIKALIKQYDGKNFTVVSISADTERKLWTSAIETEGMNWKQLSDLKGTDSGFIREKAIYAFPTYVIVSPEGKILSKPYTIERVKEALAKEFAKK